MAFLRSRDDAEGREPKALSLRPRPFRAAVLSAVRRIPPGRVATYGDVAGMAGRPRAARAVGNIMRECRDEGVPCHRVVGAGGALGGYGGNIELKRSLLRAEGIIVFGRHVAPAQRHHDVRMSVQIEAPANDVDIVRGLVGNVTAGEVRDPVPEVLVEAAVLDHFGWPHPCIPVETLRHGLRTVFA